MPAEPGITLLHKPVGATSFSLVREAIEGLEGTGRKLRVCHGGTLDPFAHGLLLLLAGAATKLMNLLHEAPKTYVAQIAWGAETDNGDPGGAVVHRGDPSVLRPELLERALLPFLGWTEQIPPTTSAKKIDGEPAYRKVHRGEQVELPASRVYLHSARWLDHALPERSTLELVCRGGYYVRALARDLGRALGARAHLTGLHRSAIGPWSDPGPGRQVHLAGRALLPWYPSVEVTRRQIDVIKVGGPLERSGFELRPQTWRLPPGFAPPQPLIRAIHQERLVALLEAEGAQLQPRLFLGRGA